MTIVPSSRTLRARFLELQRLRKKVRDLERVAAKIEAAKLARPTK
jgi:hypothetical protein|nr:hypothetical protein [Bradyrhizobium sp.]